MTRHIDTASTVTLVVTLALFVAALFIKGFTHDLLLEAGVFLVSVKLVLAGYKNKEATRLLLERLDQVSAKLDAMSSSPVPASVEPRQPSSARL